MLYKEKDSQKVLKLVLGFHLTKLLCCRPIMIKVTCSDPSLTGTSPVSTDEKYGFIHA